MGCCDQCKSKYLCEQSSPRRRVCPWQNDDEIVSESRKPSKTQSIRLRMEDGNGRYDAKKSVCWAYIPDPDRKGVVYRAIDYGIPVNYYLGFSVGIRQMCRDIARKTGATRVRLTSPTHDFERWELDILQEEINEEIAGGKY